ncbi:MAG: tetratricopeptide repeat protein, partial [bacterium]
MALRTKDPEARVQALETQLAEDPTSPAIFPLANLLWEKGDADKAIDLLTSGLTHHAAYAAPRVLLGEIYLAKEQIEEAA